MPFQLVSAARSDVGRVRADNQDSGLASPALLAVADGVGGQRGGAVASAVAATRLAAPSPADAGGEPSAADDLDRLRRAFAGVQAALEGVAARRSALAGLSTTLTALALSDDGEQLLLAHVGDSRCYRLQDGHLEQVSRDHTYVQHLVDAGAITAAQAERHPHRHLIVRALGDGSASHTVDTARLAARPGQRWLLCSDGLSGVVDEQRIAGALTAPAGPAACADELLRLALAAGAPDNVTVVVADVVEAPEVPATARPAAQGQLVGAAATDRRAA